MEPLDSLDVFKTAVIVSVLVTFVTLLLYFQKIFGIFIYYNYLCIPKNKKELL